MGAMERAALRGEAGGGALLGEPLAGGFSEAAAGGRCDGFEPDTLGFLSADRGGGKPGSGKEPGGRFCGRIGIAAACHRVWRGSAEIRGVAGVAAAPF